MIKILLTAVILCCSLPAKPQDYDHRWVAGISGSILTFKDNSLGRPLNVQAPKINISIYLFYGFILDGGFTLSGIGDIDGLFSNSFSYNSLDGNLRYDFNLSNNKIVPYLAIGSSFINAPSSRPNSNPTATFNTTIGVTFWDTHRWGFNTQMTYKSSPEEFRSMVNHIQLTVGLVYRFRPRIYVRRLWDRR
ncbi:MAG: hypothetical protein P8L21_05610 [Polaribacter sp.]|jgi:hypothetical protein|nr:hypothetical protein [Polaribacter sp.]MDG2357739.1 hypothetical protein [Polaribacter sp.]